MPKYPTPEDIAEMKLRGYEPATIAEAEGRAARGLQVDQLCRQIEHAFADLKLGDGVGLQEAQGIDDYEPPEILANYREGDEKLDWRLIPSDELNRCHSSLSFFDAEGMRFHLPAFLIADLNGTGMGDAIFHLTRINPWTNQFRLLSPLLRKAVRDFLLFLKDDPDKQSDLEDIQKALEHHWTEDSCRE